MITASAPGKLYIAGEYAVVDPGEPAVLVAVDRSITVTLTESAGPGRVHSSEYGHGPLQWTYDQDGAGIVLEHQPADYVVAAIATMERIRADRGIDAQYFDLDIQSELDDARGQKFGLGSSGAVTVAVIAALNEFYDLGLDREQRFRAAMIATVQVAPKASGGDLAACTVGGWLRYTAPDRAALVRTIEEDGVVAALTSAAWKSSSITELPSPTTVRLVVGWTGSPASTERLVDGVRGPHDAVRPFPDFLAQSRSHVEQLVAAITADDAPRVLAQIRAARQTLRRLGVATNIDIETPLLTALCDRAESLGAAAKPSGAGGGDCGIVLLPHEGTLAELVAGWEADGIRHLDLAVHVP